MYVFIYTHVWILSQEVQTLCLLRHLAVINPWQEYFSSEALIHWICGRTFLVQTRMSMAEFFQN